MKRQARAPWFFTHKVRRLFILMTLSLRGPRIPNIGGPHGVAPGSAFSDDVGRIKEFVAKVIILFASERVCRVGDRAIHV